MRRSLSGAGALLPVLMLFCCTAYAQPAGLAQAGEPGVFGVRALPGGAAPGASPTTGAQVVGPVEQAPPPVAADAPSVVQTPRPTGELNTSSPEETLVLTPAIAAQMATTESLQIETVATSIRQAQADVERALGAADFRLTAGMSVGRSGPTQTFIRTNSDGSTTVVRGDGDSRSQRLSLSKQLFIGKQLERNRQVAEAGLAQTMLSHDVVAHALDISARLLAYDVLRSEQLLRVARDQATALAAHLALSQDMLAAGTVAEFEVIQAETELARAQGELISAITEYERAKASLRRVLVLPQTQEITVTEGTPPTAPELNEADLIAQALARRPDIAHARAGVASAKASLRLAFTSRNVSMDVSASLSQPHIGTSDEDWSWQLGLSASKPILDGRQEKTQVASAVARVDAAKIALREAEEDAALEVHENTIDLTNAREALRVAEAGLTEAKERYAIASLRYETGFALGIEVIDAQSALTQADVSVVNARYAVQVATAQLRSSLGLWVGNEG